MLRSVCILLLICFLVTTAASAQQPPQAPRSARLGMASRPELSHDRGHLLVRLAPAAKAEEVLPRGSRPVFGRWFKVPIGAGGTPAEALAAWLSRAGVDTVELNYVAHPLPSPGWPLVAAPSPAFTPNDPLYNVQWHLGTIQMPLAWELSRGAGTRVAVIDTGVARGGSDLACHAFPEEYDAFLDTSGPQVAARDLLGHGTHVAGTVAQCTNNAVGVAGVAFAATLLPVVASDPANPRDLPFDALARGIVWAAEHGARVINISVGTDCDGLTWPACSSDLLNEALEQAADGDVLVVAAAGNSEQETVVHPANHPDVVAVTALDLDGLAPYPNRGEALDIAAPGGNLDEDLNADGRRDGVFQQTLGSFCGSPQAFVFCGTEGTSMAAAHVAGAAAVLRSFRPGATASQVRQALEQSALDLGQPGHDPVFGNGALRVHHALLRLDALLLEQAPAGPCQPGPTTLCIDDQPGDGRFRIEVAFATSQAGGITGAGKAIPLAGLGVSDGGLFWFFAPDNPEMLVKVLDGCGVNGKYWVFYSAGTNVGFVVTVDDTATGRRRTYSNQDLAAAPPVQDTSAFPCS